MGVGDSRTPTGPGCCYKLGTVYCVPFSEISTKVKSLLGYGLSVLTTYISDVSHFYKDFLPKCGKCSKFPAYYTVGSKCGGSSICDRPEGRAALTLRPLGRRADLPLTSLWLAREFAPREARATPLLVGCNLSINPPMI